MRVGYYSPLPPERSGIADYSGLLLPALPSRGDAVEREDGREARLLAQASLEGLLPPLWEVRPLDFPLVDDLLANAVGVIVHSRFAEGQLVERGYPGNVRRISFPAEPPYETGEA